MKRTQIPSGEIPCTFCPGKCCRYFALPIDKPENWREYDQIRWFLLHDRATVFVDDQTWYLLVHSKCKQLDDATNRCHIYETRPKICREYSSERCEFEDCYVYDQYFEHADQIEEYAEAVLGPRYDKPFRTQ
ncbi:MAG: YkgJ family cysteine cluster protein [Thermoguttaceae bacterium]